MNKSQKSLYRKTIRVNGERTSIYFSRKLDADRWYAEMKRKKEQTESGVEIQFESPALKDYALNWLKGLLGHSSPMMTLKYAHLSLGFLESRANVVSFGIQKSEEKFEAKGDEAARLPRTLKLV
jgi:hypothetical protein